MNQPFNDGYKVYTTLIEINTRTGQPTGVTKPNLSTDPNYIAPAVDHTACPPPGSITPVTYNIAVTILAGFTTTIKLLFGTAELDRTTSGSWNVVDRTYDGVVFATSVAAVNSYFVKITYNSGLVKQIGITSGATNVYIPGPFTAITKLEMLSNTGDYNGDYNDDYFN